MHAIQLSFSLTTADYVWFAMYTTFYNPAAKRKRRLNWVKTTLMATAVLLLVISSSGQEKQSFFYSYPFAILLVLFMVAMFFVQPMQYRRIFEKQAEDPDNQTFFDELTYTFSENGIEITSADGAHFIKWRAIKKKVETNDYFLLYRSALQAYTIPKQKFENAEKLNSFRILLSKHLSLEADKNPPDLK